MLEQEWLRLAGDSGNARKWWRELSTRYSEPQRHYHTLAHIEELLALLKDAEVNDRNSVEAAVWFHDVIYDTRRSDNEARSADLAGTALRELGLGDIDVVQAMINATASHDAELSTDGLLFLDCDLAILGAPPDRYREYADAIRREYAWVPQPQFSAGRCAILRRLLGHPSIYRTAAMRDRFEVRARENVAREVSALERDDPR